MDLSSIIDKFFNKKKDNNWVKPLHRKTITSIEELKESNIKPPFMFVVFDTETNGFTKRQGVLSVSASKFYYDGETFLNVGNFERFYYPRGRINKEAIAVNGLNRRTIFKLRKFSTYPLFWYKDISSFRNFIGTDTDLIVGHNSTYDRKYYWFMEAKKVFCTMYSNMKIMGLRTESGKLKNPKLMEAANFYNIPIEDEKLHASSYDTELTAKIFMEMIKRNSVFATPEIAF